MVRIWTLKDKLSLNEVLVNNESFFNINISSKEFNYTDIEIIKNIDNAELIDKNTGEIRTPYGLTSIRNLSTGCKTVLNFIYINSTRNKYEQIKAIDVTECGWNALEELFSLYEKINSDTILILRHQNGLFNCKERKYLINDEFEITDLTDLELEAV